MEIYQEFASVYDLFMEDDYYDKCLNNIEKIIMNYNAKANLILDLACGTGNLTLKLAKKGYDMIGVDVSNSMLNAAINKSREENLDILFLQQDMCSFELYGTVDLVICNCDSINYLLEEADVLKTFKLVNNYLNPKGLFIFDINTEYKFKYIMSDNSYSRAEEDAAFIWDNFYDEQEKINEFATTFFIKDGKTGMYNRHEEFHYEKAYTVDDIKNLLEEAGLEFVNMYDSTLATPKEDTERIIFVAREKGK